MNHPFGRRFVFINCFALVGRTQDPQEDMQEEIYDLGDARG
jgi:hypothetical protein